MKISVIGTGYVGLVTGACLAGMGNDVICMDRDASKIDLLKSGGVPIYESGLGDVIARGVTDTHLSFTTSMKEAVEGSEVIFIAVGTPPGEDGSADLSHVISCAREIAALMDGYRVVVLKSTIPVGTCDMVDREIGGILEKRGAGIGYDVVSNPEFLKEGTAVSDFHHPDRVIVGVGSERAGRIMKELYCQFERAGKPVLIFDRRSSEMIKYASNAMLAIRISFMNELAILCEEAGADIENVRIGMGADRRIGIPFLCSGMGYGGSCLPKDVRALVKTSLAHGCTAEILSAVERVNESQKLWAIRKLEHLWGPDFRGRHAAVWGLSFKPNTDDMREAPSLVLIANLLKRGATVAAHDPVAMEKAMRLPELAKVRLCPHLYDALEGADVFILATEWGAYRAPDLSRMRALMRGALVLDGRNQYNPETVRAAGFEYFGVGRLAPGRDPVQETTPLSGHS